jgi:diguanylate cyclase (GGDEF)-like protein
MRRTLFDSKELLNKETQKRFTLNFSLFVALVVTVVISIKNLFFDFSFLLPLNFAFLFCLCISYILVKKNKYYLSSVVFMASVVLFLLFDVAMGQIHALFWFPIVPLVSGIFFGGLKRTLLVSLISWVAGLFLAIIRFNNEWLAKLQDPLVIYVESFLIYMVIFLIVVVYKTYIESYESKLLELATIDPLTGVINRGELFRKLEILFSKSKELNLPLSVLMVDIDRFKRINDNFGHQTGDAVLEKIAAVLRNSVRSFDIVGRYGGEEFLIVLSGTSLQKAVKVADRIRETIENSKLVPDQKVTVSIGVAELKPSDESLNTLLRRADERLYLAKKKGRNRTEPEM